MDVNTTQDEVKAEVDCECGCKEGVCMCENCTSATCECEDCKKIQSSAAPTEAPTA